MVRCGVLAGVVGLLAACESGTSELHEVEVADAVASGFTEGSPGILRVAAGLSGPSVVDVLCGQTFAKPAQISIDHGFGCLEDDVKGTEVTGTAWIEPAPVEWDAAALCALATPEPAWRGVELPESLTGAGYVAPAADPAWAQATGTGTWKRDGSPCGGHLKIEYTLD
ncbi:MAG: hypothetical protein R3F61_21845 [Myxococcota bacterium]